jgi:hypothetical protein
MRGALLVAHSHSSTDKTGRKTGRREAEPPEMVQITKTVVSGVPLK